MYYIWREKQKTEYICPDFLSYKLWNFSRYIWIKWIGSRHTRRVWERVLPTEISFRESEAILEQSHWCVNRRTHHVDNKNSQLHFSSRSRSHTARPYFSCCRGPLMWGALGHVSHLAQPKSGTGWKTTNCHNSRVGCRKLPRVIFLPFSVYSSSLSSADGKSLRFGFRIGPVKDKLCKLVFNYKFVFPTIPVQICCHMEFN